MTSNGRILLTGTSGLVGSYFLKFIDQKYEIHLVTRESRINHDANNFHTIDLLTSLHKFEETIRKVHPEIIVNLAALSDVDRCEIEKENAMTLNQMVVKVLSNYIAVNTNCFLLHLSTDYVFDGQQGNYKEESATRPINWYGTTKLLGEKELSKQPSNNWCIARTSTVFGLHSKKQSFPLYVIKQLSARKSIDITIDQVTSPTYAANLAEMLHEIVSRRIAGIIHTSGGSQLSRFDQARTIAKIFGLDEELIRPIHSDLMPWKAQRPRNSSLNVEKASLILDTKPLAFLDAMSAFANEIVQS